MSKNGNKSKNRKISKSSVALCLLFLLIVNFALVGITFGRYREEENKSNDAKVLGFSPVIVQDEFTGDFSITAENAVAGMPFTVMNEGAGVGLNVFITLQVEGVLPLTYSLYSGETKIELTQEGNSFVGETIIPLGQVAREFLLVGAWEESSYDERFNGLTDSVHLSVVCEQRQE